MSGRVRAGLAQDFAAALAADFAEHGPAAIAELRTNTLDVYLRLVAAVTPEPDVPQGTRLSDMSDEDLAHTIALLNEWKAAQG